MAAGTNAPPAQPAADAGGTHIVLATQDEPHDGSERPETVAAEFEVKSPFRGTRTRLTLYEEGFLRVRTDHCGRRRRERVLDLRYLDPRPKISSVAAPWALHCSLGSGALASIFAALASFGVLPLALSLFSVFVLGASAGIFAWLFLGRTGQQSVFRTANGRADVLVLAGTVGSIGALQRIVPALAAAIREAREPGVNDNTYLRQEIREHYRLRTAGAISDEECSTCTQRILHHFA